MLRRVHISSICIILRIQSVKIFVFSSKFSSFVNHKKYKGIKYKIVVYTVLLVNLKTNSFIHPAEHHMAKIEQTNKYHISRGGFFQNTPPSGAVSKNEGCSRSHFYFLQKKKVKIFPRKTVPLTSSGIIMFFFNIVNCV